MPLRGHGSAPNTCHLWKLTLQVHLRSRVHLRSQVHLRSRVHLRSQVHLTLAAAPPRLWGHERESSPPRAECRGAPAGYNAEEGRGNPRCRPPLPGPSLGPTSTIRSCTDEASSLPGAGRAPLLSAQRARSQQAPRGFRNRLGVQKGSAEAQHEGFPWLQAKQCVREQRAAGMTSWETARDQRLRAARSWGRRAEGSSPHQNPGRPQETVPDTLPGVAGRWVRPGPTDCHVPGESQDVPPKCR